jgi:hypothetical protein
MENLYYQMMINNAKAYLKTFDPTKQIEMEITIFNISEVLAICTGKFKEDIVLEISEFNQINKNK